MCKKVILGCLFGFLFVSFAQGYDLVDLQLMASDWLIERPQIMHWEFDMSTDPVGDGPFDLMVRSGGTTNLYRMADGKMIFDSDIIDKTVIENKHQYSKYDMEYHYVARSLDDRKFHLWVDIQPEDCINDNERCFVGNSIRRIPDPGNPGEYMQEVIIWDGNPLGDGGNARTISELDPDAFITIDVDIYYEFQRLEYRIEQNGFLVPDGEGEIYYVYHSAGSSGGEFAFQCGYNTVGHAEVDHLTATTYGPNPDWDPDPTYWHSDYDIAPVGSPDGKVNLLDFAVLAKEWLN